MKLETLHNLGWSLIPVKPGSKEPSVKWKKCQSTRASKDQLKRWFEGKQVNVAVVLGEVSGHVLCMDFDDSGAYRAWKEEHRKYASTLPTVRTSRGYHVYFRCKRPIGIVNLKDENGNSIGELRGNGACSVLPPSIHPDGSKYRWLRKPTIKNLLLLDPAKAGFIPMSSSGHDTERTEENRENRRGKMKEIALTLEIGTIIDKNLPSQHGTRHDSIFRLARELKSMDALKDVDPRCLRLIFKTWFDKAKPNITTQSFAYSWGEFLDAWGRIKFDKGEGPAETVFQTAKNITPPKIAMDYYPGDMRVHQLLTLCRELQRISGKQPFFLSCRKAGEFLGCSHLTAWRMLYTFIQDDLLKEVSKGTNVKATRFRYLLPLEESGE